MALYGILRSADIALLMGAVLLFGVLATVMVATRKIDWYHLVLVDQQGAGAGAQASRSANRPVT